MYVVPPRGGCHELRSGIEKRIKDLLRQRFSNEQDTAISWVRAHVQIPGNEEADALATWSSYLGEARGDRRVQPG